MERARRNDNAIVAYFSMFDLDDSQSSPSLEASRLLDALLCAEHEMVLVAPPARTAIFERCQSFLGELRQLNNEHFDSKPSNSAALLQLETAIATLCQQSEDWLDDQSEPCARCGRTLSEFKNCRRASVFCRSCAKVTQDAREECELCFGTLWI